MSLPPEIFKAYDIRGIVGRTLTAPIVQSIGQALGTLALEHRRDTIAIGRDGRLSGPELAGALAKLLLVGIMLEGVGRGELYETRIALLPGLDFLLRVDALSLLGLRILQIIGKPFDEQGVLNAVRLAERILRVGGGTPAGGAPRT